MTGRTHALETVAGLAALVRAQAGLVHRSQLRDLGVGRDDIAYHVAAGRWRVVAPRVVAVDNGRLDAEQLHWRAVLNAPAAAWIGGRSALAALGLSGLPPREVHLLVPRGPVPTPLPGVFVHVTTRPPEEWVELVADAPSTLSTLSTPTVPARRIPVLRRAELLEPTDTRGLPLTTAARAVVDAAAWEPDHRRAAGVVFAALQQRLTTLEQVAAELDAAGRVRHRAVVRDALGESAAGTDSQAERDAVRLVRAAGLPEPRRQVVIAGRPRDLVVTLPDGTLLVIEIDGPVHAEPGRLLADRSRDADVLVEGHLLLHITTYELRHDRPRLLDTLRRIRLAAEARAAA
jgi:very-short-patch-repair endonuclease